MQMTLIPMDNGREFLVRATDGRSDLSGKIPRELFDDELGLSSTEDDRREWIQQNADEICGVMRSLAAGIRVEPPFNRIKLEGVN